MTFMTGNVCRFHPELEGKRYASNRDCPACVTARRDKWREENRAFELAGARAYKKRNPNRIARINNDRNEQKRRATPKWANRENIKAIYEYAAMLRETGNPCEVDHIVPIQHPLVCGLHCEANLAIMPKWENLKKGNRTWPDMPE